MMEIEIFRDTSSKVGFEDTTDFYVDSRNSSPINMSKSCQQNTPTSESYCDSSPGSGISGIAMPLPIIKV